MMMILLIIQMIGVITLFIISLVNCTKLMKSIEKLKSIQEDCSDKLEIVSDILMEELTHEEENEEA